MVEEKTIIINTFKIIGTNTKVFQAWEMTGKGFSHGTISSLFTDTIYGKVGTKHIPKEINNLPFGELRWKKVREWFESEYHRAYQLILAEYPCLTDNNTVKYNKGEITIEEGE